MAAKIKINITGSVEDENGKWPLGPKLVEVDEAKRLVESGHAEWLDPDNMMTIGPVLDMPTEDIIITNLVEQGYDETEQLIESVKLLLEDGVTPDDANFEEQLNELLKNDAEDSSQNTEGKGDKIDWPTTFSKKETCIEFMEKHKIPYDTSDNKKTILNKIREWREAQN